MPRNNFWAALIMSFIYLGFCVDVAIKEGSKAVLDKVWMVVALFAPAPSLRLRKEQEEKIDDSNSNHQ